MPRSRASSECAPAQGEVLVRWMWWRTGDQFQRGRNTGDGGGGGAGGADGAAPVAIEGKFFFTRMRRRLNRWRGWRRSFRVAWYRVLLRGRMARRRRPNARCGDFGARQTVSLSTPDERAVIYYTTDGVFRGRGTRRRRCTRGRSRGIGNVVRWADTWRGSWGATRGRRESFKCGWRMADGGCGLNENVKSTNNKL